MVNKDYLFHIFVTINKASIKAFNFKFENLSFTNLSKKY